MFDAEMQRALEADAEKLSGITGEPHSIAFVSARDARTVAAELSPARLAEMRAILDNWDDRACVLANDTIAEYKQVFALARRALLEGAQDRERLDWLDLMYCGADFEQPDFPGGVMLIGIPAGGRVGSDLRKTVDELRLIAATTEDTRR